jgi:hypothetical protein
MCVLLLIQDVLSIMLDTIQSQVYNHQLSFPAPDPSRHDA